MLRNIGIRSKILAVLALPVLVLLLAAGIISGGAVSDARRAAQVEVLAGQAADLTQLVRGLQAERALSVAVLAGDAEARPALDEVRGRIDAGLADVRGAIDGVDLDLIDPAAAEAVAASQSAHDQIAPVRAQVDQQALSASAAQTAYTAIIAEDVALPGRIGDAVEDRDLAAHLRAYTDLERLAENITGERDLGVPFVATGELTPEARAEMTTLITRQDVLREEATLSGAQVGARVPALGYTMQLARQKVVEDADGVIDQITVADWRAVVDTEVSTLDSTFERLAQGASARAADLSSSARSQALLVVVLAAAAVMIPVLLALFLARRITRPLRRLTEAAAQVREDLPQMVERMQTPGEGPGIEIPRIPVQSNDEVGRLAAAFNDVNATTVQVAQEQAALRGSIAAMFVNVARRDQVLLSRQLAFIDQLERTEENPATLDNLFRLDHLATRMRRNAESLLVLAGIDTGRRLRRPMPLSDVIRTASSEIEHYERIDLALRVDPPVVGHVALTTAHLLAELLENATNFSDPGSRVVVSTGTGSRGITVTIADDGLGMTPEEIADANSRIADPPASEVVGSQRLGFFVVGRLARKLDATVSLRAGRSRGTVVTIELAPALFTPGSVVELPSVADEVPDAAAVEDSTADAVTPAGVDDRGAASVSTPDVAPSPPSPPSLNGGPAGAGMTGGGLPRRGAPLTPPVPTLRPADSLLNGVERPVSGAPTVPSAVSGAGDLPLPRRSRGSADLPAEQPVADTALPDTALPDTEPADVEPASEAPPVRAGGLFSGFRARQSRPPQAPEVATPSTPESAAPAHAVDMDQTAEIQQVEVEPVEEETTVVAERAPVTEADDAPFAAGPFADPSELPREDALGPRVEVDDVAALVSRRSITPEPVIEPELVVEPDHVYHRESVALAAPEPEPEPEPAPAIGAAALDILPGRAAARAARKSSRGFRFGRKGKKAPADSSLSDMAAPVIHEVEVAPFEAPVDAAATRPDPPDAGPTNADPGPTAAPWTPTASPAGPTPFGSIPSSGTPFGTPAPSAPVVPSQTRTEDVSFTTSAHAPASPGTHPDVQPAPPSLFGTPAPAPLVFGTPAAEPTAPTAPTAPIAPTQGSDTTAQPPPTFVAEPAFDGVADTAVTAPGPVPQPIGDVLRQRSALASEALTELSRLSTYRPAVEPQAPAALARRTPASTPAAQLPPSRPPSTTGRRTRTASDVRSMLSGFQAGVERGRTSPAAHSPDHPDPHHQASTTGGHP